MTENLNERVDEKFKDQHARDKEAAEAQQKAFEDKQRMAASVYTKTCSALADFAKLQGDTKRLTDSTEFKKLFLEVMSGVLELTVNDMDSLNSDITLASTPLGRDPATGEMVFEEVRALKIVFNSRTVEFHIKMNQPITPEHPIMQRKAQPRGPKIVH